MNARITGRAAPGPFLRSPCVVVLLFTQAQKRHVIPGPHLFPLIANRKRDNVRPRCHGDELSAIEHVGHGRRLPCVIGLDTP